MRSAWAVALVGVLVQPTSTRAQPPTAPQVPDAHALPTTVPLFPLQDVVLFPNMSRPLHIFEPRYREMVSDAVQGDGYVGMVLLRPGYASLYEGNPPIFQIGCAGEITQAEELSDGRWIIVLRGTTRFRVLSEDHSRSYRVGEVEPIEERHDAAALAALETLRLALTDVFADLAPGAGPRPADLSDEDLVNGLAQFLDLEPVDRQVLLEAVGPLERAQALLEMVP